MWPGVMHGATHSWTHLSACSHHDGPGKHSTAQEPGKVRDRGVWKEGKARAASLHMAPCSQSSGYICLHLSPMGAPEGMACHTPSLVIFVLNGGPSLGTIHFNFDLGVRLSTVLGGRNSGVCASCPRALPRCFLLTSCALEKLSQDAL